MARSIRLLASTVLFTAGFGGSADASNLDLTTAFESMPGQIGGTIAQVTTEPQVFAADTNSPLQNNGLPHATIATTESPGTPSQDLGSLVSYNVASSDDPDANPEQLLALLPDGKGQATTSMDELDLVLGQRQIFTDLRSLQDRIVGTQRPMANLVVRHSVQSDHLDIDQAELSQDLFFSEGRSQLRLGLQAIDYNPKLGSSVTQYAAGATGNQRINDIAALTGEFWLNQLRTNGNHNTKATYDTFFTLKPSDTIRIDIDTSRRLFDNITSLDLGLTSTSYGGSIDFTPMDGLRLTGRGAYSRYSDGNRRRNEELEGVWRVRSQPIIIEVGAIATNFHFDKLLNDGYFNPKNYYSGAGMFRIESSLTKRLTAELAGSAGIERADPGGSKPLFKGSFQLAYKLFSQWSLDGELSHFSSRQSTSSGFSRTTATLGLHHRF